MCIMELYINKLKIVELESLLPSHCPYVDRAIRLRISELKRDREVLLSIKNTD